jgi:dipeptidase E
VPHFTNVPFRKTGEKIVSLYSDKLDLRPISNNQTIIVDGDKIETITVESKK